MPTQSQKDLGTVLIICTWQLFGYVVFLCLVPMSWIKWLLIDHVVPFWFIRDMAYVAVEVGRCFV